jgi:soluble lytic murein transglycosylase-like protein
MRIRVLSGLLLASAALAGCTTGEMGPGLPGVASAVPTERPGTETASASEAKHGRLDRLIAAYSAAYDVPASLVHRVVKRESNYNPGAYHAGNYGLMQIRYRTAKGMGYEGSPHGLLDAETNLKYAVRYLKGAWLVAGGSEKRADRLYQTGYYYDAKRKGMLDKAGWNALAAVEPAPIRSDEPCS